MRPRIPMIRSRRLALAAALAVTGLPALAGAQEAIDEAALLEGDPLLEPGLKEPEPEKKVEVKDPDPKLHAEVEEKRLAFEKRINELSKRKIRFEKLEGRTEALTADFLREMDAYIQKHAGLMTKLRSAAEAGDEKQQKKIGAEIMKVRKAFLRDLEKLTRTADKLQAEREKLLKKYQAEQAAAEEGEGED